MDNMYQTDYLSHISTTYDPLMNHIDRQCVIHQPHLMFFPDYLSTFTTIATFATLRRHLPIVFD